MALWLAYLARVEPAPPPCSSPLGAPVYFHHTRLRYIIGYLVWVVGCALGRSRARGPYRWFYFCVPPRLLKAHLERQGMSDSFKMSSKAIRECIKIATILRYYDICYDFRGLWSSHVRSPNPGMVDALVASWHTDAYTTNKMSRLDIHVEAWQRLQRMHTENDTERGGACCSDNNDEKNDMLPTKMPVTTWAAT